MNKHWITLGFFLLVTCFAFGQAPTGFSGTGYRTTVHLKWDNYTAFTPVGYNIYRSTVSNSFGAPARRVGAYTDYTDYGLNASTTYFYKISAFDAAGNESALTSQITVATNSNNYLKVASLDLLIPIYLGGMAPNEPNDIRQELEFARQFYFRNTKGQLNLKFHYLEIPGYPPPNTDGVGDFATIGTDLHNRGILDNQYDAIHVEAYQTYGFWGGAGWLGQTAGSMAHQPAWYYNPNNHYTTGDAWVFVHEFGHSLDGIIAGGSGFPDMLFNHFPWAFPLPAGIASFDVGTDFDGMAMVLRLFDKHLNYAAPWDGYIEATDSDGDKLANNDDRLPMDEADFGSSPATDDSDLDGLTDAREFYAGNFGGSNPNIADTDGDGTPDGTDPYPISNFRPTLQKTTAAVTINGTMAAGEGWQPLVSNPNFSLQPGATFNSSATWDNSFLYFAFQSNTPMKYYLYMDGSGEDGVFASPIRFPGGNYNDINDAALGDSYYENAVLVIRSDASQVMLKNSPVAGSQISTTSAGGVYTTEVRIPHNIGPGFGWTYTPPTAPVVISQQYTTGDIIGINLVALPLANAVGFETDDWRLSNMVSMNEPFHFYDITLTGGSPAPIAYCPSKGNFPWEDWIAKVQVGSFQNVSGKSQYSDFTSQTISLTQNVPVNIQLTTGYSYFTWNEHWRVWIDFNHDGVFSTPDEVVQQQILTAPAVGTPTASVSGSINVPASALTGPTRMRVSMKRGAFASSCEVFPFGEVEDYTVNIGAGQAPKPDLTSVAWEIIPSNQNCYTPPGSPYTFLAGLVRNPTQVAVTTPFVTKAWLSKDATIGAGDILWQALNYTGIGADAVAGLNINAPVPASTPPGVYNILVKVDADNVVDELDETNNTYVVGNQRIGTPDFVLQNLNGLSTSVPVGGTLTFSVQVRDLANFPLNELTGSVTVDVLISPDNIVGNGNDIVFASQMVNYSQFSGGVATINVAGQIAGTIAPGQYFLLLKVNANCESNYLNNSLVGPSLTITGGGTPGSYCASTSSFPWEDWIGRVKINDLDNPSGKSNYSNFTNKIVHLKQGLQYSSTLTTAYSYFTFDEYWKVWVDLDQDGVFEFGEEVLAAILHRPGNGTTNASVTQTLIIPPSALIGTTRMRVSMKRNGWPMPCETLPFGEVEDYTVEIQPAATNLPNLFPSYSGVPASGQVGQALSGEFAILNNGTVAVSGSYSVGWYFSYDNALGPDDELIGSANLSNTPVGVTPVLPVSVTVPGWASAGSYYLFMVVDNGNQIAEINEFDNLYSYQFTVLGTGGGGGGSYCTSVSAFPWHEWVSGVKINGLEVVSGKSTYSDFTGTTFTLNKNSDQNTVKFTGAYSYFVYPEYWMSWVDFNHNGVFEPSERLFEGNASTLPPDGANATQSINGKVGPFPNALTGPTRMRVSMKRYSAASPCEELPFGEVEDFTVNIVNTLTGDETDNRAANLYFQAVPEKTWVNLSGAYHFAEPVVQIEVEKSVDGNDYEVLETVQGKATPDNSQTLQVRDEQPNDGFNYYRMLVLLENGEEVYSPVKIVAFDEPLDYTIFPNPATSEVFIQLTEAPEGEMQWNINDAYGRVVWSQKISPDAQFPYRIDVSDFRGGMYYLFAQQSGRRAVGKRFVVVK